MKKLATLMLGMSFLVGAAAFAQDASTQTDSSKTTTKKKQKKHKKGTDSTDQSTPAPKQ